MSILKHLKNNQLSIFLFVLAFFPTIRLLLIGSGHSTGISLILGLLPEILFSGIAFFGFLSIFNDPNRKIHVFDKIVLVYFLFNVIMGVCLAQNLLSSVYGFRLTYLPMIGYFVCSFYWDKQVNAEKLFHGIFKTFVLIAVLGFIIYFIFPELLFYFNKLTTKNPVAMAFPGFVRMTSILWTPVVFAMLMLSAFCYWTYRYFKSGSLWDLIYMLIVVNAVFFSVSRGPMITACVAFLLLIALGKNWKFKMIATGVIVLEILLFFLFVPQFTELMEWVFISSKQTVALESTVSRVSLWGDVINSVKYNPMGLGLGKAGHAAVQLFPAGTPGVSFASTDGWYFKLMIETGIPALILYLLMSLFFFISMIRYQIRNGIGFVTVIFAILIVTGLVNLVSNALDFYMFSYLYWFLLGIFVFKLKQEKA
jgi:hypothetical protein